MAANEGQGRRRRRGADEWRAMLSRFNAGSLSVEAFCLAESVSTASFYRWRALLGKEGKPSQGREAKPAFVDLGTLRPAPAANNGQPPAERLELKLDLGGGLVLHLVRG
jgi:putative transposase